MQEALRRKEAELHALEERYKKCIEKAKSVVKTLEPKQNPVSAELAILRSELLEKYKIIEDLEVCSSFLFVMFACSVSATVFDFS